MFRPRTLATAWLILFSLACRDLSHTPTDPTSGGPTIPPLSPASQPGAIVVRLVSLSEDMIQLAWCDTDSTRTSYAVERKDADSSQYVVLATLSPSDREYSDGGVKEILRTYYYRISAVKGWSEKVYSNAVPMCLNPRRPLSVRPIHISPNALLLQWNFTGNITNGFLVQRSFDGKDYSTIGTTPRDELTFLDQDLDTTRVYYYRAFTLTQYSMGPSSVPLKVGYAFNPLYASYRWMAIL